MSLPAKLFIQNYGCQMNERDADHMRDLLLQDHSMMQTFVPEEADLVILNTCSIREKAQEKVFSELGRWHLLKKKKPSLTIAVGGCVASQEGEQIIRRAPYVDLVFGPQTIHRLPELYADHQRTKKPVIDVSFPLHEKFDKIVIPEKKQATSFVSIMEGCSKFCSYCVVPYTRGEEISRSFDGILEEVYQLAEKGCKEIVLLGQNVNDYRGMTHDKDEVDLALLIHYISALDGIERIRFTTSHPQAFSDTLIQAYAEVPKLVNQLHLPVQSGSNRILTGMKRGYNIDRFYSIIDQVRQHRPDISISSDFIVGFPGETEQDFQETMNLVDAIKFDQSFSFIYSQRPGTPASDLPDDTPMSVKKERLAILQERIKSYAAEYSQAMLHNTYQVLVTGTSKKDDTVLSGRTENNRIVNFIGPKSCIGEMVSVTISEVYANSLRGRLAV
ncbi:MAG: tRNA (N6-isopentenyl adenosine(37)-C2)-methylthiotransferase MiaB [Candidatus Comchoanobacterales bacterium]